MAPPARDTDPSLCIKCGFCMSVCPLYREDYIESHVARGRNMLIKMANNAEMEKSEAYKESIFFCLLCGRCETVCPANIASVDIALASRRDFYQQKQLPLLQRLIYRGVFARRPVMANTLGLAALLPGFSSKEGKPLRHLADFASIFSGGVSIPKLSKPFLSERVAALTSPASDVARKEKVAFFPGCSFEFFFAGVGETTVNALVGFGFEVNYPRDLACCGLAVNSAGDSETARMMAKQNIEQLLDYDLIVTGCATCGSTLKEYAKWFQHDDQWQDKARTFSNKVKDLSELVVGSKCRVDSRHTERVTFHDPCHLRWRQGIHQEPRAILRSIKGLDFVEMQSADACCGLGGSFGLKHRETSLAMQKKKIDAIAATGAQTVVTSCPGCMIQLMDGIRRHGLKVAVKHISQYL
jgi:glycolate oxidase iron-sulfur subunit